MAVTLFSPSWYRVSDLKPRVRSHVEISRHDYRGKVWHVLQDHAGGRTHRLPPAAYHFIGLMDGKRKVQKLWEIANTHLGGEAPTQDEIIRLLGQLHAADALICDVPPDSLELFRRYQRHERMRWRQRLWTPLAVRIPLIDPDRFLSRTLPVARPFFSWFGVMLWLAVVITGAIFAGVHWAGLTENIIDRAMTPQNLLLLWLVYPVVKTFHELGHGYATKMFGGEVHEIGIMFLVLIPVPYVDASAASGFRDKRHRMVVGAVGIGIELFFGAIAMFTWINVEAGVVHTIAYNVMLISGVSTLFFNGNPLLRFDGYYVLADALEIPNLGTRSNKFLGYLAQRYLFGARDAEVVTRARGEQAWMVFYGIAAFIYRLFIMFAIILYIGGKFFAIGVVLAIWASVTQIFIPIGKNMKFLFSNRKLKRKRGRAVGVSAVILATFIAIFFILPAPLWTRVEGITWPSEQSQVRTGADGFVTRLLVDNGAMVSTGQPLIESTDPFLEARVEVLKRQLSSLVMQHSAVRNLDRVQAQVVLEEISTVKSDLARARERATALVTTSPRDGRFIIPKASDMPGRFLNNGQLVAYVIDPTEALNLRVVVTQDNISLVRDRTRAVAVMPVEWGGDPYSAQIYREVPGGTQGLPSAALGTIGGGIIPIDPRDGRGLRTMERVFEFEIALPEGARTTYLGQRMLVRFDHGSEPLGFQIYRAFRQLFLKLFDV